MRPSPDRSADSSLSSHASEHQGRTPSSIRCRAARYEEIAARLTAVRATLADAQKNLDNLQSEAQRLEAQRTLASEWLSKSRAVFMRAFLSTIPDDILRCIFEEVAALPDDDWETIGDGTYNDDRAMHPFLLASVCSRWRRVALALPRLWTYIGISDEVSKDDVAQHVARVPLLLLRSRTMPLDIFVHMYKYDDAFTTIASMLTAHSSRWRRMDFCLPSKTPREVVDGFKGPMPRLTELSIRAAFDEDHTGSEGYFPYVPSLRTLELSGTLMFLPRFCATPPPLTSLRINIDYPCPHLVRLLELVQNTLEELDLTLDFTETPSSPVTLPMLHTLSLSMEPFFVDELGNSMLIAPKLRCLKVEVGSTNILHARPLLQQLSRTVTELALYGASLDSTLIATYGCLVNLTVVHLGQLSTPCGSLFAHIATSSAPYIWPRLEQITFGFLAKCDSECYDGLLLLLATRSRHATTARDSGAASDADSARPCKIRRIDLQGDAPSWVAAEVKRLLSL